MVTIEAFKKAFANQASDDPLAHQHREITAALKTLKELTGRLEVSPEANGNPSSLVDLVTRYAAAKKHKSRPRREIVEELREVHREALAQTSAVAALLDSGAVRTGSKPASATDGADSPNAGVKANGSRSSDSQSQPPQDDSAKMSLGWEEQRNAYEQTRIQFDAEFFEARTHEPLTEEMIGRIAQIQSALSVIEFHAISGDYRTAHDLLKERFRELSLLQDAIYRYETRPNEVREREQERQAIEAEYRNRLAKVSPRLKSRWGTQKVPFDPNREIDQQQTEPKMDPSYEQEVAEHYAKMLKLAEEKKYNQALGVMSLLEHAIDVYERQRHDFLVVNYESKVDKEITQAARSNVGAASTGIDRAADAVTTWIETSGLLDESKEWSHTVSALKIISKFVGLVPGYGKAAGVAIAITAEIMAIIDKNVDSKRTAKAKALQITQNMHTVAKRMRQEFVNVDYGPVLRKKHPQLWDDFAILIIQGADSQAVGLLKEAGMPHPSPGVETNLEFEMIQAFLYGE
jgi:hypothetical protein